MTELSHSLNNMEIPNLNPNPQQDRDLAVGSSDLEDISPPLLHILRHSIGIDDRGRGQEYRNRFVTDPSTPDGKMCQELCEAGLMQDDGQHALCGGMHVYSVTGFGKQIVRYNKPAERPSTASARRYQQFLGADTGMSFSEWLKARARMSNDPSSATRLSEGQK